jgi:Domain of unknown function (DUF3416)
MSGAFHIEDIYPIIDGGRFPVKRIQGEAIEVWADIYRDGHEIIDATIVWRREQDREWQRVPMTMDVNDRWHGTFTPNEIGRHVYLAPWLRAQAEGRTRRHPRCSGRRRLDDQGAIGRCRGVGFHRQTMRGLSKKR